LSTFYVELDCGGAGEDNIEEPISIHVAFDCFFETPIHLSIEKGNNN
jgi:hypothetical protein